MSTNFKYLAEHQEPLDFPDAWWELYEMAEWPEQVDYILPENISRKAATLSPSVRDPLSWIFHWFGITTIEMELAQMILRDILGYNPYQHWHGGCNILLWWHLNAGDSDEYEAHALNELTYRLGYTEYQYVPIDRYWTGNPF